MHIQTSFSETARTETAFKTAILTAILQRYQTEDDIKFVTKAPEYLIVSACQALIDEGLVLLTMERGDVSKGLSALFCRKYELTEAGRALIRAKQAIAGANFTLVNTPEPPRPSVETFNINAIPSPEDDVINSVDRGDPIYHTSQDTKNAPENGKTIEVEILDPVSPDAPIAQKQKPVIIEGVSHVTGMSDNLHKPVNVIV